MGDFNDKLGDIDKIIRGFEEVIKEMKGNPDYEMRINSIKKLEDSIGELKAQKAALAAEKKEIEKALAEYQKASSGKKDAKELGEL